MLSKVIGSELLHYTLSLLFLWSCEVNSPLSSISSKSKLTLDYKLNASGYSFFIQSLLSDNKALFQQGDFPNVSESVWSTLDVIWGFRKKIPNANADSAIYWVQKNETYQQTKSSANFSIIASDSTKQEFIPQKLPDSLLQEDETNLEIYSVVSSSDFSFAISNTIDFPLGLKQNLANTIELIGNVINQETISAAKTAAVGAATIYYINKTSRKIFQTFSKADGTYRIFLQGYGNYFVSVLREGMSPRTKSVTLLENPENQILVQDIMLNELPSAVHISNNQLYDISNSMLELAEGTGPSINGISMNIKDRSPVSQAYLLFYRYPDKVYFQRSNNSGSFSGKLPSSGYSGADEKIHNLSFYPSAYGYRPTKGFLKLTNPYMIDVVRFEADRRANARIFNNPPSQLKIIKPLISPIIIYQKGSISKSYEFCASALETDSGDFVHYTWEIFAQSATGSSWANSPTASKVGQNVTIDFASYPAGEYLAKVSATDSWGAVAVARTASSASRQILIKASAPKPFSRGTPSVGIMW